MATIAEWKDNIQKMTDSELESAGYAISDLKAWKYFWNEYEDHGLASILTIIKTEVIERKRQAANDLRKFNLGEN